MEESVSAEADRRRKNRPVPVSVTFLSQNCVWSIEDGSHISVSSNADGLIPSVVDYKVVGFRIVGYAVTCDGEGVCEFVSHATGGVATAANVQRDRASRTHNDCCVSGHREAVDVVNSGRQRQRPGD